jgi:hypothetical protein
MVRSLGRIALVLALCSACGGGGASHTTPARGGPNVITHEQLRDRGFPNAYESVEVLHRNWLLTRGADNLGATGQVQVYLDNRRMGNVNALRTIPTQDVAYIRYFDRVAAPGRWGQGHEQGVILVATFQGTPGTVRPR